MDHPVFDHLVLGYSALIGAKRQPVAHRLTLHPLSPDPEAAAALAPALAEALTGWWPAEQGLLCLNPTNEAWLQGLLDSPLPAHLVLEVPAFLASEPEQVARLQGCVRQGHALALKGRPLAQLPPELASVFRHVAVDLAEERRQAPPTAGQQASRKTAWVQSGVSNVAQAAQAFERGAWAVQGWPLADPPSPAQPGARKKTQTSVQVVMDLIQRVDREEPVGKLDAVFRSDPSLAFRLLRLINSAAFGLSVEISSFQHAIMMLGYERLKRWLALLLTTSVDDPDLKPLMGLSVRRGLLMEELARSSQADEAQRSEAFICGVFSLLDRMLGEPFDKLLPTLPVAEGVAQTLRGEGPHSAGLALAVAVESELPHDIVDAGSAMLVGRRELNRAAMKALLGACQMQAE